MKNYIYHIKKTVGVYKHFNESENKSKRTTHKKAKKLIYSLFITSTVVKNNKIEIQHHIYTY